MSGPKNKKILFAVLNWGLGHATRSIPLIQALSRHNTVVIASTGRSLELLKGEFPDLESVDFPDYGSHYSKFGFLLIPYLGLQVPVILWRLVKERHHTKQLVEQHQINMLFSDSRFGVYARDIPSYFITHQLRFPLPPMLKWMTPLSEWYNRYFFNQYHKVFVVDAKGNINLSRDLSHKGRIAQHDKLVYVGALSSISPKDTEEDIDVLVSISGPESARTYFEETILRQIGSVPGKKVVVLGKPGEQNRQENSQGVTIYNHVSRAKMTELMNRAKLIVCRSGYSTVMELIALNKPAVLVPTPGQTEQEYLARYYEQQQMFHVAKQHHLDLRRAVDAVSQSNGKKRPNIPVNDLTSFLDNIAA